MSRRNLLLALSSAILQIFAFPNFNQPWAAWIALVPWLVLLSGATGPRAFWWSYAIGFLFFLGSVTWLIHVTLPGLILLCAYMAVFEGAFGWLASRVLAGAAWSWSRSTGDAASTNAAANR